MTVTLGSLESFNRGCSRTAMSNRQAQVMHVVRSQKDGEGLALRFVENSDSRVEAKFVETQTIPELQDVSRRLWENHQDVVWQSSTTRALDRDPDYLRIHLSV